MRREYRSAHEEAKNLLEKTVQLGEQSQPLFASQRQEVSRISRLDGEWGELF